MLDRRAGVGPMRYLVQLLVPVLIFASVVYLLTRGRRSRPQHDTPGRDSDTGVFILILLVSAAVAISTAFMLSAIWD